MKRIQLKIDKKDKTAALYISGKLITLTIPYGWGHTRIGGLIVKTDKAFAAYLNATACETENELAQFIPHFDDNWEQKLNWLREHIKNKPAVKVETVRKSVAVIFRDKLNFFLWNEEGYYEVDGTLLSVDKEQFALLCSAAICETEEELQNIVPMLNDLEIDWKDYANIIRISLRDNSLDEALSI